MKFTRLAAPITTFMILAMVQAPLEAITVRVDCDQVEHRMAGGIGASWHAMSREFKIDPKDMHGWKDTLNSRGSAWGGNPPIEWVSSWKQIC
ncbi:MAG: hypothetical protein ACYSWQ_30255, partial [Planctomycetota bacterium]